MVGQRTLRAATSSARGFLERILLITVAIAALGAFLAWRLARGVARPLVELTGAAEAIAGGNYGRRARIFKQNEIGRLGGAFNRMAEEIEARVRAIRMSESRFRSLVTASAQIVWSADAEGNVVEPLSTWQAFTGQSFEQLRGRGWADAVHPDDREGALNAWQRALERRSAFMSEYRLRRHDGEYRWFVSRGVPVLENDGRIREWVGTCTDVTERNQAEQRLRQKEEELRQSQKMEAVGRLAGGIAHDFNNLLTAILGPADMARDQIPADHPARRELDDIRTAALRASELTRQLLTFGRQQVVKSEPLDLNEIVRDSGRLLGRLLGENIDIDISLAEEPCALSADRSQIEQIILNLAVNSRDAMPDGGQLTIETRSFELNREFADRHPSVRPGAYVMLAVSDTGRGMDAETLAHAFEPFFTTKEAGRGTGLGLATVYGIVHQSGGHVFVYSEVGKGTTFNIYLPRATAVRDMSEGVAQAASTTAAMRGGTETILLAEDDNAIRALIVRLLTRSGYKIIAADRGEAALELARALPGEIHLLVTDVVMPGMSGVDLWQLLREQRPRCRVLFLSGWASDAIVRHGVIDSNTPFLQKPFTAESLIRSIREVLDRA
jgi:PAS domain S-box-containing protein